MRAIKKSTKKKISIILFFVYSVLLVLILTFGSDLSKWVSSVVQELVINYEITDVEFELDITKPLEAKKTYSLGATPIGNFYEDAGLKIKSSDSDVLFINNLGSITTFDKFDGPEAQVDVTITSKYDKDFKKVITLTVKKVYPSDVACNYTVKGYGFNAPRIMVGMTIFPYCYPDEGVKYSSNEYEIIHNEEYFVYDENEKGYVAIKETEGDTKVCFTIRYPDGREYTTPSLAIDPYTEIDSFDEIRSRDTVLGDTTMQRNKPMLPVLYKDGKPVLTKVEVTCSSPDALEINYTGQYIFKKSGDFLLTFTLPNGYYQKVIVRARNKMALPVIENGEIADTHYIKIYSSEKTTINYTFPGNVTYKDVTFEYDDSVVQVDGYWHRFIVTPKGNGTTTLKIILDDGRERLEDTYTIEVVKDDREPALIRQTIKKMVPKIMGHMAMFCLLGFLAINMFRFVSVKNKFAKLILIILCGLPTAALTELIQMFMPGRTATPVDVLIDMSGYLIGVLIATILFKRLDKEIYIWTAIDLNKQLTDVRKEAESVSRRIDVRNAALTLPLHLSLKISCPIKARRFSKAVEEINKHFSGIRPFEILPIKVERCGGVIWIRHEESPELTDLHNWLVDLFERKYGVEPHEFDLEFIYHTSLFVSDEKDAECAFFSLKDVALPRRLTAEGFVIGCSESGKAGEYRVIKAIKCK